MIYPAKSDWWITCLVVSMSLLSIGIGAVIAYLTAMQAMPPVPGLLGAVLPFGIGGLLL